MPLDEESTGAFYSISYHEDKFDIGSVVQVLQN